MSRTRRGKRPPDLSGGLFVLRSRGKSAAMRRYGRGGGATEPRSMSLTPICSIRYSSGSRFS